MADGAFAACRIAETSRESFIQRRENRDRAVLCRTCAAPGSGAESVDCQREWRCGGLALSEDQF